MSKDELKIGPVRAAWLVKIRLKNLSEAPVLFTVSLNIGEMRAQFSTVMYFSSVLEGRELRGVSLDVTIVSSPTT